MVRGNNFSNFNNYNCSRGLNSIVEKLGLIGPAIVVLCIGIGIVTLFRSATNLPNGLAIIENGSFANAGSSTIKNAGPNCVSSALSYAGFVLLWFASFMTALGATNKKKDITYGIFIGTIAICTAILVVMLAQIANINTESLITKGVFVWNADIPNLILAEYIWQYFAHIFAIVVFAGIYTTAVPLLYNPCSRFAKENSSQFKILAFVLGFVGLIVGLFLPFRVLINIIYVINGYVINGYVGAVLILFMLLENIRYLIRKVKAKNN